MAPGQELDRELMLLTQTSQVDYDELCRLDVLGLEDVPGHDQQVVYAEFKEQLRRDPEGWYETGLPWKGDHAPLPTNEQNSLRCLEGLTKKLLRNITTQDYDAIIQEQEQSGVVESADQPAQGREFYIPHTAVIRESAETTKIRIVYDASARANPDDPSLNECLYTRVERKSVGYLTLLSLHHGALVVGQEPTLFCKSSPSTLDVAHMSSSCAQHKHMDGQRPLVRSVDYSIWTFRLRSVTKSTINSTFCLALQFHQECNGMRGKGFPQEEKRTKLSKTLATRGLVTDSWSIPAMVAEWPSHWRGDEKEITSDFPRTPGTIKITSKKAISINVARN